MDQNKTMMISGNKAQIFDYNSLVYTTISDIPDIASQNFSINEILKIISNSQNAKIHLLEGYKYSGCLKN